MRKPVPHRLSEEELQHLNDFHSGGLMRKSLPAEVQAKFIEGGYIRRATGGHVLTNEGMEIIYGKEE